MDSGDSMAQGQQQGFRRSHNFMFSKVIFLFIIWEFHTINTKYSLSCPPRSNTTFFHLSTIWKTEDNETISNLCYHESMVKFLMASHLKKTEALLTHISPYNPSVVKNYISASFSQLWSHLQWVSIQTACFWWMGGYNSCLSFLLVRDNQTVSTFCLL